MAFQICRPQIVGISTTNFTTTTWFQEGTWQFHQCTLLTTVQALWNLKAAFSLSWIRYEYRIYIKRLSTNKTIPLPDNGYTCDALARRGSVYSCFFLHVRKYTISAVLVSLSRHDCWCTKAQYVKCEHHTAQKWKMRKDLIRLFYLWWIPAFSFAWI